MTPIPVLFIYSDRLCSCTRIRTLEVIKALHQHENLVISPKALFYTHLEEAHFQNYPILIFQRLGANGGEVSEAQKNKLADYFARYRSQTKFIYDLDDLLLERQNGFPKWMLSQCHAALAPNEVLAQEFRKWSPSVHVIRTHIDEGYLEKEQNRRQDTSKVHIAWFSTGICGLSMMSSIAKKLEERLKGKALIHLFGDLRSIDKKANELPTTLFKLNEIVPHTKMHRFISECDFVINPVGANKAHLNRAGIESSQEEAFNNSKSEIKFLHAGLFAKPLITSPTPAYRFAIDHGKTGFLAETADEWLRWIEELVLNGALRESVGNNAQKVILEKYTLKRVSLDYKNLFFEMINFNPQQKI